LKEERFAKKIINKCLSGLFNEMENQMSRNIDELYGTFVVLNFPFLTVIIKINAPLRNFCNWKRKN
jgi:hypothetical protein